MKDKLAITLLVMLGMEMAGAEARVFTNKEGKTLEAELLSVEKNKAVLKLDNGKQTKVSMETLSEADQEFIKKWWEENKGKATVEDFEVKIDLKSDVIKRRKTGTPEKSKIANEYNNVDLREFTHILQIKNVSGRDIGGITAKYTVYRLSEFFSNKDSGFQDGKMIGKIEGASEIIELKGNQPQEIRSVGVRCLNTESNRTGMTITTKEKVLGISVVLNVGGQELPAVNHPENLPDLVIKENAPVKPDPRMVHMIERMRENASR